MTQAYARPPAAGRAIRRSVLAAVVLAALAAPAAWAQAQAAEPIAALIEEFGPIFDRHDGTVRWTSEMQSPGAGEPPEPAVRADVAFPERGLTLSWVLRRNADRALPASHTIEIMFKLPADFAYGGIAQVPAMAAKSAETRARGAARRPRRQGDGPFLHDGPVRASLGARAQHPAAQAVALVRSPADLPRRPPCADRHAEGRERRARARGRVQGVGAVRRRARARRCGFR